MTGDPDESEDILGFGDADHARSAFPLATHLDRLALRVTRRPRLAAIAAGLVVAALVAGAVAYLGPASAAARPSATARASAARASAVQPRPVSTNCTDPGHPPPQSVNAMIAEFLKGMRQQPTRATSSAYSSTLRITVQSSSLSGPATTYLIFCP